jgi:hypothetical protein
LLISSTLEGLALAAPAGHEPKSGVQYHPNLYTI